MPSDHPWVGYFLRDNPYSEGASDLHAQGFLVRTRADAGIVYDEDRWMTAYNGLANAISMDTEEGLMHLDEQPHTLNRVMVNSFYLDGLLRERGLADKKTF